MKSRILVSVVGVPILLYIVLWAPEWAMAVALSVLAGTGAYEMLNCVGAVRISRMFCCLTVVFSVWIVLCSWGLREWLLPSMTLYCFLAFALAVRMAGEIRFNHLMAGLFGALLIPYAFSAFFRIQRLDVHRAYLLLPFILSFACDTFAYFTGLALGKHKLAPKVSPKKTVEGAVGGLLGNLVCGLLFAFVMKSCFYGSCGSLTYPVMILLSLLCGVVAQIGDLSFSLIKREFGVKDYGRIFFDHGGVLDRFDSVLFVAPALAALMELLQVGWRCVGG